MNYSDIIPYTCVYLDAAWDDFFKAAGKCVVHMEDRKKIIAEIKKMWTNASNQNPVLPCLSVRTAFDLYLRIMNFPQGSEVIVSAINIPDMITILHHHGLRVVSLDVSLDTLAPKLQLIDSLVSEKTVAILLAHVYGKWFDTKPFVKAAQKHGIVLIEDCAEGFCGYENLGNPDADLSLFSFGVIKYYTAFGGGVAKVKDPHVYQKMVDLYASYPTQPHKEYLKKILKYSLVYVLLNCPRIIKPGIWLAKVLTVDHKKMVVNMLRGFPSGLISKVRHQPSTALLSTMLGRMKSFDPSQMDLINSKAEYVSDRLPESVTQVGTTADVKNYWLFPIIVENPDDVVKALTALGVDAYRGATQLNIVEPDNGDSHLKHLHTIMTRYPHEAKFLMDHVVYLPVNKTVPFYVLDKICKAVEEAVRLSNSSWLPPVTLRPKVKLQSKL